MRAKPVETDNNHTNDCKEEKGMKMKRIVTMICSAVFLMMASHAAYAAEFGTPAEAEAMAKKAVAYLKANGKEKALAEISNPKGQFVDRDLYVTVYDMTGKCLAHGFNQKMIGKDMIGLKDPDGKLFIKERIEMMKTKEKGWQDFKFTNPISKKIEDKTAYIEKVGDVIVMSGAYKK